MRLRILASRIVTHSSPQIFLNIQTSFSRPLKQSSMLKIHNGRCKYLHGMRRHSFARLTIISTADLTSGYPNVRSYFAYQKFSCSVGDGCHEDLAATLEHSKNDPSPRNVVNMFLCCTNHLIELCVLTFIIPACTLEEACLFQFGMSLLCLSPGKINRLSLLEASRML
ncbi:hypothetical protein EJ08DRAFT_278512 [Tothia fuscella]|uniref:Uncharacterized protein n=1 Tax=Tothia fuscella TaxID=1048955 RepID=A0A9P4NPN9_9PEZI|nr:hypothetical protein EJ08DRAFT_278512 [Tothia fuscella]